MRRSLEQYLGDILQAIAHIQQFLNGVSFEQYRNTPLIYRATEREFTIIGEAVRQMEYHFPEVRDRIEHIRMIVDFRNFIIHEYSHVDDAAVWETAVHHAPVLRSQIEAWQDELGPKAEGVDPSTP